MKSKKITLYVKGFAFFLLSFFIMHITFDNNNISFSQANAALGDIEEPGGPIDDYILLGEILGGGVSGGAYEPVLLDQVIVYATYTGSIPLTGIVAIGNVFSMFSGYTPTQYGISDIWRMGSTGWEWWNNGGSYWAPDPGTGDLPALCPCCNNLPCECEICDICGGIKNGYDNNTSECSKCNCCEESFNPLRCLEDIMQIFTEQPLQTFAANIIVNGIYFALSFDVWAAFAESFDEIYYDFFGGVSYTQGTLYNWNGTVYYDCTSEIIKRAAQTGLTVQKFARPIESTSNVTIRRVDKMTGEVVDTDIIQAYPENEIIFNEIDRWGFPAIGDHL